MKDKLIELAVWSLAIIVCSVIGAAVCKVVVSAIEHFEAIGCWEYHNQEACERVKSHED